ncbi:MAG: antitoxin [Verrucomicrobiaceae bacterium]|nr:MAG: antitoxin [Verrucomicrobiaceae bacterium]
MKMTLELPDDLVRQMKLQAVQEGRKLKDVAEQVFRRGLAPATPPGKAARRRVRLPLIECRHAATKAEELTPERVADLLLNQEVESLNEAARR